MFEYAIPNREAAKLLLQIKRLVKEEFGVRLRLDQEDLVDQVLLHWRNTKNPQLRELLAVLFGDEVAAAMQQLKDEDIG